MSLQTMAEALGRHASTLCRELKRGRFNGAYSALAGHRRAGQGKARPARHICGEVEARVRRDLSEGHSPEQISGRLAAEGGHPRVSAPGIRKAIVRLERQARVPRPPRKPYCKRNRRPMAARIPDRKGIEERPAAVHERVEMGHWEVDLVIGAHHSWAVLVAVERVSRYVVVEFIGRKYAHRVEEALVRRLKATGLPVLTLTFDNGLEFYRHARIAKALDCQAYFCHPYCSWEKGSVENMNGLLRRYLPKKAMMSHRYVQQWCIWGEEKLNHRPRKCLGYRTPWERSRNQPPSRPSCDGLSLHSQTGAKPARPTAA